MGWFKRAPQNDPQVDPQDGQETMSAPTDEVGRVTVEEREKLAAYRHKERMAQLQAAQVEKRRAEKHQERQEEEQRRKERQEEKQQRRQERRVLLKKIAARVETWLPWKKKGAAQQLSHLEQVRQVVEEFDEDKRHPLERLLLFTFTVASYILPVVIALYIGWEIGDAYGGVWRPGDSFSQGMHITAFAGEIAQAMFVVAISFAARAFARKRENLWLLVVACVFFVIFILASGLAQWYVSKMHITPATNAGKAGLVFRVAMPALFDIGAALFLAIVNVKDLKRFLQQQGQKEEAIEQVNKSILRVEEAQAEAKQRQEQHQQYIESMKATQGLVIDLQRIITERILEEARGQQPRSMRTTVESQPASDAPQLPARRRLSREEQEREEGTEETSTSVPISAEQSHQSRYVEVAADQLQRTIEALTANPNITDEELAEVLGLKRTASARYWRLKAVDLLMGHQSSSTSALPAPRSAEPSPREFAPLPVSNGRTPADAHPQEFIPFPAINDQDNDGRTSADDGSF